VVEEQIEEGRRNEVGWRERRRRKATQSPMAASGHCAKLMEGMIDLTHRAPRTPISDLYLCLSLSLCVKPL